MLVGLREEWGQLKDSLSENYVYRFRQIQILYGYLTTEDSVNFAVWIEHGNILLTYDDQPVILLLCILYYRQHSLLRNVCLCYVYARPVAFVAPLSTFTDARIPLWMRPADGGVELGSRRVVRLSDS